MRLLNRLQRLEKAASVTQAVDETWRRRDEEQRARLEAAWAVMRETMSEDHARLVVDAYAARLQDGLDWDWSTPAAGLLRRCLDALQRGERHWPYSQIRPEVALAMPPAVAEIYLAHPYALPLHDCEDCGYEVPREYFRRCPLCGGRIGWYAYWENHKDLERPA